MFTKKHIKLVLGSLILITLFTGIQTCNKNKRIIYTVKKETFTQKIQAEGTIQAGQSKVIKAPSVVHGNTQIINLVKEGTQVQKGDFLVQFDTTKFQNRLREAKSNLQNAKANFRTKKANFEKQRANLKAKLKIEKYSLKQAELREKNATYAAPNKQQQLKYSLKKSQINYNRLNDKVQEMREINDIKLKKSRIKVEQAKTKLQEVKDNINKLTITSPTSGLIVYKTIWSSNGKRKLQEGDTPWRGAPLIEIPSQGKKKVEFQVRETQISQIKQGQTVELQVDAMPDSSYQAMITKISSLAHKNKRTNNKVFEIGAELNSHTPKLKPGMSARCTIIINNIQNAIVIPLQGLINRNNSTGVLMKDGSFQKIQTAQSSENEIVVKEGLNTGDQIQLIQTNESEKENSNSSSGVDNIFSNKK